MLITEFTTKRFNAVDRYDAWRARPWPSLATLMRTDPPEAPFFSHARAFRLGSMVVNDTRMTGQTYHRIASMIRADGFDHISIAVNLKGRFRGETPFGTYEGKESSVLIGHLGLPFTQTSTSARCVTITMPRSVLKRFVPNVECLHGLVLSGPAAAPLVDHIPTALARAQDGSEDEATIERDLMAHVLTCLGAGGGCQLTDDGIQMSLRAKIGWIIDLRCAEKDFDVRKLALLADTSRASLYRAFSGSPGLAAHLRTARLAKAASALRDPNDHRQIREIADSVGFKRMDHFSHAFREEYGCTAREWRSTPG
ncbi:helix-turn-helix transcriptional regulator [Aureimonas pseudogalii]|uniref:AraC-like DNA-binding protein n=1 Tax=Aureimonas pseudogalii TaxID=1744844 RepID=A0A7W6H965_9HYPH|nr:helix-turn-helix domain-containing protein [Aureimonas pseudogalii]MBB4000925.1 AraC-like DNA-binding protein [Aureimonas pseudogalii]